ncbi:P-loop containing nucleoside triphosphate hydrolase protein [Powellomyces hirtus]|nr:P-loop containing nucleoside triphosphate hydrolase protein [Powellomyces hirtus]
MEIETILLHSVTAQRQRTSKANTNDITSQDLQFGSDLFEANQLAVLDANHGAAHSGIFRNPSDRATLTKREQTLLNQCLLKPDPATGSFNRVGGLAETKRTIEELISLPLTRPELFRTGILSTTGILLFGPPGTGKTLLARAVAAESGANFLNVQMSDISSMWVGENEKNVKSLFSLARKLAPTVIFVDEIDALLRARQRNAAQHMTNTINEFMQEWDGISSGGDASKAVIVVGATNRPFDLDEAVLRRLPRRILVPLPNAQARKEILTICLKDDEVVDREKLAETVAEWTEGWSGSDLRNFCIAAGTVQPILCS